MLVNAISHATKLVNKHARKRNKNGTTPLEASQEKLTSTKRASKRLGEVRRMGQTIFSPHIMNNRTGTKYSDIFLQTYWKEEHSQPLYDSSTPPQQTKKNKEKQDSTGDTNTETSNNPNSTGDQLDDTNTKANEPIDDDEPSDDDESVESYDFEDDESMARQKEVFLSYEERQTDTISQLKTQFKEVEDDATESSRKTSTKKEKAKHENQPAKDGSLWHITDQEELLRILSARIDALHKPTITNLEARVTQGQEHRAAMETTLDHIQATMTSTETDKDERTDYIQSLHKLKTSLDKTQKSAAKRQQHMEATMDKSEKLLEALETKNSALEEKTRQIETRITAFAKAIFDKEHQRFATQIQNTTESCIAKLKTAADGLKRTQLLTQERHNQTVIKQGIDTLQKTAEAKQDETLDLLDVKASELEELARQTLDAIPGYIQEELQNQVAIMKTIAETEIEHHGKNITLDIRKRMKQDTTYMELKEDLKDDLRRDVGNTLKQQERTLQDEIVRHTNEFENLVAQRKMDIKSVTITHRTNLQSTAVTELQHFKADIQLATAALMAQAAENPHMPTSNDEASANNSEQPDDNIYDSSDYDLNTNELRRENQQRPHRFQNVRAMSTTSHLENFDNKVRITRDTTKLNSIEATQLYNYLSEKMATNQLPIKDIDDLRPRGSCIPQNAETEIGSDTIKQISKVLYRKIRDKVSDDDDHIKAIVNNHSIERDGYKTLYDIMRHFQPHLQDIPMLWGPTWLEQWSPREYVTQIKQQVQQESKMDHRIRTQQEQVIEMVLQSQKIPHFSSTTGALMMQLTLHGRNEAFKNFELSQLATLFDNASHPTNSLTTTTTKNPVTPNINKFNGPSQRPYERNTQPREKIQCNLCHQFGHSLTKGQVCRDAAKIYWIVKDFGLLPQKGNEPQKNAQEIEKQLEIYRLNATQYKAANKIYPQIKKAILTHQFDGLRTEEQEMDVIYKMLTIQDDSTEEDETQPTQQEEEVPPDFL